MRTQLIFLNLLIVQLVLADNNGIFTPLTPPRPAPEGPIMPLIPSHRAPTNHTLPHWPGRLNQMPFLAPPNDPHFSMPIRRPSPGTNYTMKIMRPSLGTNYTMQIIPRDWPAPRATNSWPFGEQHKSPERNSSPPSK